MQNNIGDIVRKKPRMKVPKKFTQKNKPYMACLTRTMSRINKTGAMHEPTKTNLTMFTVLPGDIMPVWY